MANTTVYPFGTEGSLPSGYPIINDLVTGGADKALAAEQGKVIFGLLTEETPYDLTEKYRYVYWIDNSNKWYHATDNVQVRCLLIQLDGEKYFSVTADGGDCSFAFLKSDTRSDGATPDFCDGYPAKFYLYNGNTKQYQIPSDANYLYVFANISSGSDILGRYKDFTFYYERESSSSPSSPIFVVYPKMVYMGYQSTTGEIWGTYQGTGLYSTPRFIAVSDKNISFTVGKALDHVTIFEYGADFSFIQRTINSSISANTKYDFTLSGTTAYIKILLCAASDYSVDSKTTLKVEGTFPRDWDVFNLRSSDSGYQRVMVSVRVTDPTCCDEETQTVQDDSQILTDYGVICLPTQYSNVGRPTRLIIYCHGAAVNYSSSVSRFDSQDLDPTYWLAEGYAILDVEGNPFDNTNEHICIPQAMECYVAAYKWAIEYYNLCRDGVFLGGRSMGGQNTFNLMRRECPIPVIAACPNSAAPDLSFGYSQATRKAFCALHMGFDVPSGFTWSDGALTNDEKQVLSDNWDKYIKCCPELSACIDLPDKEILLANPTGSGKIAVWETLHMTAKCPVKLFGCNQDQSCAPANTTALYYRMLMNAGQIAECRLYNSYKDYTGTGTSAHHYDTQDPALRTTITTSYGEELTNVPIVYIEMLAFWRRYEQSL